ncbi:MULTISPECIES: alpha/beta hydrolase-fold protein [Pseudoalteromonas]|uniref:Esterase n=1 Tax=Pseudoalteromonas tetraodonis TaxID=43659 RepID=A0ABD4ESM4_9GAMM|nr:MULTISPECIES: alpha/beta hydrolase-fold protein [Pseudoalteromonas]KYL36443.1 esterase [Pseudoalteromonas spiralis]MDN3396668.1 alpha/beta hydrolase-fold protein [Pseudoalteromonas sp. APC 3215]MDN3402003.1 alpha/beta hydrolase-fold protein [Pseudoalteromonas sp. APC 3213]MDN3432586.1 alpha/beta hydrolase-fold protein [Pseudoalteromonas sp. APC 3907]MDN3466076.1 alpha/beta hydrolase-fold protein [Pseudoalteromonas sp. APC 3495]
MKALLIVFINLYFITVSYASENIVFAKTHQLTSVILGEQRSFSVYLPPSYNENPNKVYPVIYLLDGDQTHLKAVAGLVETLSTDRLEQQIQQAIIVAIPNSKNAIRERDFTPTNVDRTFNGKLLERFENIGNALNYSAFFEKELIPLINKNYQTSTKRVLIGESFGGLFASYVLLTNHALFTDYLIIDATYLWDNNYLNRYFNDNQFINKQLNGNVYFTFANNVEAFGEIGKTNYQWGLAFAKKLKAHPSDNLVINQRYFEDETHGTVAALSWYYGIKELLSN